VRRSLRAGFTLIEVLIAMTLAAVVIVKLTMIMDSASDAGTEQIASLALEDRAREVLDKIAYAVMSAGRDQLLPDPESPEYSTSLTFNISLGVQDGEVILSDPEQISGEGVQVFWKQNPGLPEERRVAWCNTVRPVMWKEIGGNLLDDNGNGLSDEPGLSFTLHRDAVTIRLCLERPGKDGTAITQEVETVVTLRN
jgi:prepilin-type N-terminal cleavage/methylation domain-containing protein